MERGGSRGGGGAGLVLLLAFAAFLVRGAVLALVAALVLVPSLGLIERNGRCGEGRKRKIRMRVRRCVDMTAHETKW